MNVPSPGCLNPNRFQGVSEKRFLVHAASQTFLSPGCLAPPDEQLSAASPLDENKKPTALLGQKAESRAEGGASQCPLSSSKVSPTLGPLALCQTGSRHNRMACDSLACILFSSAVCCLALQVWRSCCCIVWLLGSTTEVSGALFYDPPTGVRIPQPSAGSPGCQRATHRRRRAWL